MCHFSDSILSIRLQNIFEKTDLKFIENLKKNLKHSFRLPVCCRLFVATKKL